jgi:hypothetical protein
MSVAGWLLILFVAVLAAIIAVIEAQFPLKYRLWKQKKKNGELPSILGYNKVQSVIPMSNESIVSYQGYGHCKASPEDVIVLIDGVPARHIVDAHSQCHKGYYDRGVYYDQGVRKHGAVSVFLAGNNDEDRISFCKQVIENFYIKDIWSESPRKKFTIGNLIVDLPYNLRPKDITQAMNQLVKEDVLTVDEFGYYSWATMIWFGEAKAELDEVTK